jgi:hypothetical protein
MAVLSNHQVAINAYLAPSGLQDSRLQPCRYPTQPHLPTNASLTL